jgi:hypothetical protein
LESSAEAALDELALRLPDPAALNFARQLLTSARDNGIDAAYEPLVVNELLTNWLNTTTWDESREFLAQHRTDLLAPNVRNTVAQAITDQPDDPTLVLHDTLLDLAALAQDQTAFDTLADPEAGPATLRGLQNSADTDAAEALARLLLCLDLSDDLTADAHFHLAIVATRRQDNNAARHEAHTARRLAPHKAPGWLAYLVTLAPTQPHVAALTTALTEPEPPEAHEQTSASDVSGV